MPATRGRARTSGRAGEDVARGERPSCCAPARGSGPPSWAWPRRWAAPRCAARAGPRVALLVTGDELTEPGEPLAPGGIYSSNALRAGAQVERAGARSSARERVPDTAEATRAALGAALDAADVVVRLRRRVGRPARPRQAARCASSACEERFWGVSLRPGKPTWFGARERHARLRPARQPGVGDGHLPAVRAAALAALQGADPDATRARARLARPSRATRARAGGARAASSRARTARRPARRRTPRARTCSRRCWAPTAWR